MLQNKFSKVFNEMGDFFTSSEKALSTTMNMYNSIRLSRLSVFPEKHPLRKNEHKGLLFLFLVFPLFSVKNVAGYLGSNLKQILEVEKDALYRFKNDSRINWRSLLYRVSKLLLDKAEESSHMEKTGPRCLVIDDSDLPKTGRRIEHISRIFSHVTGSYILGFKLLLLGYWDGKGFTGIDFSLHKEKGKNKKKPDGMSKSEAKRRYKKERKADSHGRRREQEISTSKIDNAIAMILRALGKGFLVDYVLVDSWFTCEAMIKAIVRHKSKPHFLGMGKAGGNSKYLYKGAPYTAKELWVRLRKEGKQQRFRKLGYHACTATVHFKDLELKVFISKTRRNSKLHILLTTNTELDFPSALEVYSIRWGIEVFFKECKQHFGLGKSQSRDFDAQVADTAISIMQYNIFSQAKRFLCYETLGGLFEAAKQEVLEVTVNQRIWGLMLEMVMLFSEIFDIDIETVVQDIMNSNKESEVIELMTCFYEKAT